MRVGQLTLMGKRDGRIWARPPGGEWFESRAEAVAGRIKVLDVWLWDRRTNGMIYLGNVAGSG